jgi:hypothetical protein
MIFLNWLKLFNGSIFVCKQRAKLFTMLKKPHLPAIISAPPFVVGMGAIWTVTITGEQASATQRGANIGA